VVKGPTLVAKSATRMGHPPHQAFESASHGCGPAAQRKAAQTWAAFSLIAHGSACHFVTRKTTLLLSSFLGVVTSTVPVVAPAGTVVVIAVPELLTANVG
jgi:hypothetical protein